MKIVVVDDEQLIVTGLSRIIRKQYPDITVIEFTDPLEALDHISRQGTDLMITDIRMPGMSGLKLVSGVRAHGVRYCAVLTGLTDIPLLQESIRQQVCDYLIKPVNKAELYAMIDRVQIQMQEDARQQKNSLVKSFSEATLPDREIVLALKDQLERSDCPADTLAGFLSAASRALPYWEICRLAARILRNEDADRLAAELRAIPLIKVINSKDVRAAIQAVNERYQEDLSLSGIAAEVYLQPNYFTTLFKKETGTGFIQFLNNKRIDAACVALLKESRISMPELAQSCGVPSSTYFFSTFKKLTGVTPGAFRDELVSFGFIPS